jgi:hypothetical protein
MQLVSNDHQKTLREDISHKPVESRPISPAKLSARRPADRRLI